MDQNPYRAPQAKPTTERPTSATTPLEAAFWVLLLLSPALLVGAIVVYWWFVP